MRKYPVGYDCASRLYRIWKAMHSRCYYPSHDAYYRYGGVGAIVCEEWHNYLAFITYALSSGYEEHLTIDRKKDHNGVQAKIYNPGNCKWSTMKEQENNKDNNLPLSPAFGETKSIRDWFDDRRCCVPFGTLRKRVESGRSVEWSLTAPPFSKVRRKHMSEETKAKISAKAIGRRRA